MFEITDEEVRRIARLARLHLQEEEVASLQSQLGRILELFSVLQAADLPSRAAPAEVTAPDGGRRADAPEPSLSREQALAEAPESEDGLIRIPRALG